MANAANEKVLAIIKEAEKRHAARPGGTGSTCCGSVVYGCCAEKAGD